jgi:hypothetical protein
MRFRAARWNHGQVHRHRHQIFGLERTATPRHRKLGDLSFDRRAFVRVDRVSEEVEMDFRSRRVAEHHQRVEKDVDAFELRKMPPVPETEDVGTGAFPIGDATHAGDPPVRNDAKTTVDSRETSCDRMTMRVGRDDDPPCKRDVVRRVRGEEIQCFRVFRVGRFGRTWSAIVARRRARIAGAHRAVADAEGDRTRGPKVVQRRDARNPPVVEDLDEMPREANPVVDVHDVRTERLQDVVDRRFDFRSPRLVPVVDEQAAAMKAERGHAVVFERNHGDFRATFVRSRQNANVVAATPQLFRELEEVGLGASAAFRRKAVDDHENLHGSNILSVLRVHRRVTSASTGGWRGATRDAKPDVTRGVTSAAMWRAWRVPAVSGTKVPSRRRRRERSPSPRCG